MPPYTQAGRPLAITTPLAPDALLLEGVRGTEAVSELFHFDLELLADARQPAPDFARLVGQPASVRIGLASQARVIHGVLASFEQGGPVPTRGTPLFWRYRAELVPAVWRLTLNRRCRVFQDATLRQILEVVFAGLPVNFSGLAGMREHPRRHCAQYHESDFAFACRLLEDEGFWYFFRHTEQGHEMMLGGVYGTEPPALPGGPVTYDPDPEGPTGRVRDWSKRQQLKPGSFFVNDYQFAEPASNTSAGRQVAARVRVGEVEHSLRLAQNDGLEVFEHPGGYATRVDSVSHDGVEDVTRLRPIHNDNGEVADMRLQELQADAVTVTGTSDLPGLTAGHRLSLTGHRGGADGDYLLTRVEHSARMPDAYLPGGGDGFTYSNRINGVPAGLTYRPARKTPRPRMPGLQIALVTGPEGQDVFTDRYGRVKVQFFWDRQASNRHAGQDGHLRPQFGFWPGPASGTSTTSSCWVRVAQGWAGPGYGNISVPRIGQEVVIGYLQGDPDQPMILGCLYNGANLPPVELPENATHVGLVSRSLGGGQGQASGLVIRDQPNAELTHLHSERDMIESVQADRHVRVGGNVYHDVGGVHVQMCGSLPADDGSGSGGGGGESTIGKTTGLADLFFTGYFEGIKETFGISSSMTVGISTSCAVGESMSVSIGGKLTVAFDMLFGRLKNPYSAVGSGSTTLSYTPKTDVCTDNAYAIYFGSKNEIMAGEESTKPLKKLLDSYQKLARLALLAQAGYSLYGRKQEQHYLEGLAKGATPNWTQSTWEGVGLAAGGGFVGMGAIALLVKAAGLINKSIASEATKEATKKLTGEGNALVAGSLLSEGSALLVNASRIKVDYQAKPYVAQYDSFNVRGVQGVCLWAEGTAAPSTATALVLKPGQPDPFVSLTFDGPTMPAKLRMSNAGFTLSSGDTAAVHAAVALSSNAGVKLSHGDKASVSVSSEKVSLNFGDNSIVLGSDGITLQVGQTRVSLIPSGFLVKGNTLISEAQSIIVHRAPTLRQVGQAFHTLS